MGHGRKSGIDRDSQPAVKIGNEEYSGLNREQIEEKLRNKDVEEMVILSSTGETLAVFRGGTTGIDFYNSPYRDEIREAYKDAIVIHNHPQGYEKFGGTLTPSDIRQMARGEWAELTSVSKDPGRGNYTVRRLQGASSKALTKSLRANRDAIENAYTLAYAAARRKALNAGKTKEQADIIANKKGANGYHQWWKKYLPKYGYEYTAWK